MRVITKGVVPLLAAFAVFAAGVWTGRIWTGAPALHSEYQAVLLSNGSVYFGKLEGLGSAFPMLREVYYVQSGVDPQTKEPKNILLKRGNEWHKPDFMILDGHQIVLVEPVSEDSRVSSLIREIKLGK
jgi:hypothetical protein